MRRCDRRGRRRRTAAITTAAQAANNRRRTKVDHVRCILEDRLSGLPDDILAHILSFLETTEAAGTSALSRRWRNTWTLTDTLNFDQSDYSGMVFTSTKEFILLVDKALYSHQSRIKGFKVGFWLNGEICKHAIDRWLTHALEKRVQKVELDFKSNFYSCFSSYILTSSLLCDLKSDSLKILQLKFVPVSGEVLTHILSNCPFLEVLRVHDSNSLIELNVPGSAWNLKCLEIVSCSSMTCLKILSTNLLSFAYSGQKIHMLFTEVPRIVHLSIGGGHAEFLVKNANQFSGLTSLLESLMLDLSCSRLDDDQSFNSLNCPKFLKLKQLKLMLPKPDIDVCINVLQASPLLRRFTLQIPVEKIKRDDKTETLSKVLNEANFTHNHLEEIALVGFTGREVEISLLLTLVQCCVACKKVIVYSFP